MSRPYMRFGAAELQGLFDKFQHTNPTKLLELREELLLRSTQKALDLLEKVDKAIATISPQPTVPKAEPHQLPLAPPEAPGKALVKPTTLVQVLLPTKKAQEAPKTAAAQNQRPDALLVTNPMTPTDAAKVLGVAAGASWEVVEKARHVLLTKSLTGPGTPETDQTVARVNLAYLSLAKSRCF